MKFTTTILPVAVAAVTVFGVCSCEAKQSAGTDGGADAAIEKVVDEAEPAEAVVVLKKGETIAPAAGKLVVIDFNATWCGPCRQFAPNFDAVARKNADKATFYSVDVDVHPGLAAQYAVQSIPTVVYITPDGTTDYTVGYMDEAQFASVVAGFLK